MKNGISKNGGSVLFICIFLLVIGVTVSARRTVPVLVVMRIPFMFSVLTGGYFCLNRIRHKVEKTKAVTAPNAAPGLDSARESGMLPAFSPENEETEGAFTAPDAHLLIVDDMETNLRAAGGLLAPYRMKIAAAESGEEAVELVKQYSFDLILMDHIMPGMDGIEATALIRKWEESQIPNEAAPEFSSKIPQYIPIIALTGNAVSGTQEMFLEKGFNGFLSKPIERIQLNEVITRWIPSEKKEKLL